MSVPSALALSLSPLAPVPRPPTPSPEERPPRRVLLVEDDPLQARGLLRLLGACGALAHHAATAEAALQAIASEAPYDAVISDLGLAGLPGEALAERLRRPLLIAYSGSCRDAPWFDAAAQKPALRELLQLLGARRLRPVLTQAGPALWQGRLPERGISCRGPSPAQVLRLLAQRLGDE